MFSLSGPARFVLLVRREALPSPTSRNIEIFLKSSSSEFPSVLLFVWHLPTFLSPHYTRSTISVFLVIGFRVMSPGGHRWGPGRSEGSVLFQK